MALEFVKNKLWIPQFAVTYSSIIVRTMMAQPFYRAAGKDDWWRQQQLTKGAKVGGDGNDQQPRRCWEMIRADDW